VASHAEPRSLSSALREMAQAYRQSAILMTACELRVFTHLSLEPLSAEALAQRCQVPRRGLQRLLNACVVLDLLEKDDEHYHNTPIAQTFLVQDQPGYMGDFIAGGTEHYEAWGRLAQAIREDRPVNLHSGEALPTLPPSVSEVMSRASMPWANARPSPSLIGSTSPLSSTCSTLPGDRGFTRSLLPSANRCCARRCSICLLLCHLPRKSLPITACKSV
jgi:hypothetical protein